VGQTAVSIFGTTGGVCFFLFFLDPLGCHAINVYIIHLLFCM